MSDKLVYFNAHHLNDTKTYVNASINITRSSPILINPSEYKMSIIRFDISTTSLPLTKWNADFIISMDSKLGVFSLTLDRPTYGGSDQLSEDGWFYSINEFVNYVNYTLNLLYLQMKTLYNTLDFPPVLYFENDRYYFIIPKEYITENIRIFFHPRLYNKIFGLPIIYRVDLAPVLGLYLDYKQCKIIENLSNLPIIYENTNKTLYRLISDVSNSGSTSDIRSIYMNTTNMPIVLENISYNNTQESISRSSDNRITDFILDTSSNPLISRTRIVYLPTAEYRYIQLKGTEPMFRVGIDIFFTDFEDIQYRLKLAPKNSIDVKILFEKFNN